MYKIEMTADVGGIEIVETRKANNRQTALTRIINLVRSMAPQYAGLDPVIKVQHSTGWTETVWTESLGFSRTPLP